MASSSFLVNWRNVKKLSRVNSFLSCEGREEKAWDYSWVSSGRSHMMLFRQNFNINVKGNPTRISTLGDRIKVNQKWLDKLHVELFLSMSFKINKAAYIKLCNSKLWICCYSHYEYFNVLKIIFKGQEPYLIHLCITHCAEHDIQCSLLRIWRMINYKSSGLFMKQKKPHVMGR